MTALAVWAAVLVAAPAGERWYELGQALTDRAVLTAALADEPPETYVLIARERPGVGQPAFDYYSRGDTAFHPSSRVFEAASAVKLMAAVGALWTLGRHGLTGEALLDFEDGYGRYRGKLRGIYTRALAISSNHDYDRLVMIAGYDELNGSYLGSDRFPGMLVRAGYGRPYRGRDLRRSPEIRFREGERAGVLPPRVGVGEYAARCPHTNCLTLFEAEDVIRRVVLHDELPDGERFPLHSSDARQLRRVMRDAPDALTPGATAALGHPVTVYNKVAYVAKQNFMETSLVEDRETGLRWLVGASVRFDGEMHQIVGVRWKLSRLVERGLAAVLATPPGPPLQADAGVAAQILPERRDGRVIGLRVRAQPPDAADRMEVWAGRRWLGTQALAEGSAELPADLGEGTVIVLRLLVGDRPVGHRSQRL